MTLFASVSIAVLVLFASALLWALYGIHAYRKACEESDRIDTNSEAGLWSVLFLCASASLFPLGIF